MRDPGDHAANFLRVHPLGNAMDLAKAQGLERLPHFHGAPDATAHLTDADGLSFGLLSAAESLQLHASAPSAAGSSSLPRRARYCSSVRRALSASNVALTTLCGLAVPSDLVRMF